MGKMVKPARLGNAPAPGYRFTAEGYPTKYANSGNKSSLPLADLQAFWLASRARISLDHARAVRELAFPARPA